MPSHDEELKRRAQIVAQHLHGLDDERADFWHACFSAALDETQDFDQSLEMADRATNVSEVTEQADEATLERFHKILEGKA
jgi:truncated hemoglobin YjbI